MHVSPDAAVAIRVNGPCAPVGVASVERMAADWLREQGCLACLAMEIVQEWGGVYDSLGKGASGRQSEGWLLLEGVAGGTSKGLVRLAGEGRYAA